MTYALKCGMSLTEYYDSTPRDLYYFIKAANERREEDIEQTYDNTRRIMWASIAAMAGDKVPGIEKLIPLKRDKANQIELTPFVKQRIKSMSAEMDNEMGI